MPPSGCAGCKLCVPRSALPEPDPEEYYHTDLVGLRAEVVERRRRVGALDRSAW